MLTVPQYPLGQGFSVSDGILVSFKVLVTLQHIQFGVGSDYSIGFRYHGNRVLKCAKIASDTCGNCVDIMLKLC